MWKINFFTFAATYSKLKQINKMKKVIVILTAFVFVGLVACGPSAAEKEQKKREQDSLVQDSLMRIAGEAAAPTVDSTAVSADSTQH
jgi:hypothetical protein